jgi:hypothetical protein
VRKRAGQHRVSKGCHTMSRCTSSKPQWHGGCKRQISRTSYCCQKAAAGAIIQRHTPACILTFIQRTCLQ